MANLVNPRIVKANPNNIGIIRTDSLIFKTLKFGAKMTSAGQGAVSDDSVEDQGTVDVPEITETIQYWG